MKTIIYEFSCWVDSQEIAVQKLLWAAIHTSRHKVMNVESAYYSPQGYTCVWLLAESHLAMHTYPERHATYIQLSSCSKPKYDAFKEYLESKIELLQPVENISDYN